MTFKKFLSVFVLTFFVKFGFSQVYQSMPQYGYGPVKRFDIDSSLTIPTTCGVPSLRTNLTRKSAIAFDTCNNRFYFYNSKTLVWDTIKGGGSTIDTANKWVNSVTKVNDSTIRVVKGTTTSDIVINPQATRLVTEVYNKTGSPISKGAVVYIDGKHSNNMPSIALAEANNENNSYKTFALVADNIANMSSGYVIQAGTITGLNLPTSTYTDGDILYLSPTSPGGYTTTKPLAPNHIVKLGSVVNAHPTQGRIEVKIENGWQLDELSDVSIAAVPNDSTLLQFSRVDSLWHDVSPTTAIGSRYIKPSDTASMLTNYAKTSAVNLKVNISDTASMLTNYAKISAVNLKVNISDTATMLSKYLRKTDTATLSSRIDLRMRFTDTATMLTPYLRKTDTASLSSRINAKFTLPTLTSGSVLYSDGTTIAQNNSNFFWDNTNVRLGIGTNAPTTSFQINRTNTDYTNTLGAGSHIYMTNPSAIGQNVVASFINGALVAKWRTDNVGNISWVAGTSGSHDFYTKGDFGVGNIQMRIFNGGNVQISTSAVSGANTDAGYKLDVQGTGRFTNVLLSTGNQVAVTSKTTTYTAANTDEIISCSGASGAFTVTLPTAVGRTGQRFTIKKNDSGANAITVGTTSSQTIDGSTTYSLASQWKYVTVVSNGSNWLIIANN